MLQAQVNEFHSENVGKRHPEPKALSLIPTADESCLLFTSNKVTPSQKTYTSPRRRISNNDLKEYLMTLKPGLLA